MDSWTSGSPRDAPGPSVLRLLAHRARAQWPLLAALLGVVMVGATLLGGCALLITRSADRLVEVAAARAVPDDVSVTAYTVNVLGQNAPAVAEETRAVLTAAVAPFTATTSGRASSVMRLLPKTAAGEAGVPPEAYLSGVDD